MQDIVNLHSLHKLEGTFSLDLVHMIWTCQLIRVPEFTHVTMLRCHVNGPTMAQLI